MGAAVRCTKTKDVINMNTCIDESMQHGVTVTAATVGQRNYIVFVSEKPAMIDFESF
jgi:hypothetical protein